jgi:hypothetical protein
VLQDFGALDAETLNRVSSRLGEECVEIETLIKRER